MNPGVPAVYGAAGCQSSSPLITGTRNSVNIVLRHFVMARNPATFISRVQHAKCEGGEACPGRRKTGLMRKQLHTGKLMNNEDFYALTGSIHRINDHGIFAKD